jgi:hypothetical protein
VRYASTIILALLAGIVFFPSMISQIFLGYRGQEAFSAISMLSNYPDSVKLFYELLSAQQFSGVFSIIILAWILLSLFRFVSNLILEKLEEESYSQTSPTEEGKKRLLSLLNFYNNHFFLIFLASITVFVFFSLAIISPYQSTRYLFSIYPLISIIVVYFTYKSVSLLRISRKVVIVTILSLFLILNIFSIINKKIDYLYPGYHAVLSTAEQYDRFPCVFITNRLWTLRSNVLELSNFQKTNFIPVGDEISFPDIDNFDRSIRGLILYIDNVQNQEEILAWALSFYGFENYEFLYALDFNSVYFFYE